MNIPPIGSAVWYRTDGRNGLVYDLPAIVTCTQDTHPGDYPDGAANPMPVPQGTDVHLTVFTPGGFGTTVADLPPADSAVFIGAATITPGSGTYVEWSVPFADEDSADPPPRSWRWAVEPEIPER